MIITTSNDETNTLLNKATRLSKDLNVKMYRRQKKTIKWLHEHVAKEVFVVNEKRGLSYYKQNCEEVFFHPNMAILRMKQIKSGQPDGFVTACGLEEGMSFLDCTLGLASDAIVALSVVKETGQVIGIEKSFPLSVIVSVGLNRYVQDDDVLKPLLEKFTIVNADNLTYLKSLPDKSVDVIYFDFMFNQTVESSAGIKVIKPIVSYDQLTPEHVHEAKRVARKRIVAKSSHDQQKLQQFGFEITKKNTKRHFLFATIEL